jgi:hypothetical protein
MWLQMKHMIRVSFTRRYKQCIGSFFVSHSIDDTESLGAIAPRLLLRTIEAEFEIRTSFSQWMVSEFSNSTSMVVTITRLSSSSAVSNRTVVGSGHGSMRQKRRLHLFSHGQAHDSPPGARWLFRYRLQQQLLVLYRF